MRSAFPPIEQLLPHADGMLLLERVLSHDPRETRCATSGARSALFANADGSVPSWLGIEYMAQCAAVHRGLAERDRGERPRPGLLLGSRRLALRCESFAPGDALEVSALHHRGELGLVAFDCAVRSAASGETLVAGRVNLYLFRDWGAIEGARG